MTNIKKLLSPYSQASLAEACGVSQGAISHICTGRKLPSARLAKAIEIATNGEVQRWQLLPDIFDPPAKLKYLNATR